MSNGDVHRILGDLTKDVKVRTVGSYVPTAVPLSACGGKLVLEKNHLGLGRVFWEDAKVLPFQAKQKNFLRF